MPAHFAAYVVASKARRPAHRLNVGEDPRGPRPKTWLPVGVRHAVPTTDDRTRGRKALCGESLAGWHVFLQLEFAGGNGGDCLRCVQVLRAIHRADAGLSQATG